MEFNDDENVVNKYEEQEQPQDSFVDDIASELGQHARDKWGGQLKDKFVGSKLGKWGQNAKDKLGKVGEKFNPAKQATH